MDYWLGVLAEQIPAVAEKAVSCEGATPGAPPPQYTPPLASPPSCPPVHPHHARATVSQTLMGGRAPTALAPRG